MWVWGLLYWRFDVGFYLASKWSKWVCIETMLTPEVCISGDIWCHVYFSQHFEGMLSLWEKTRHHTCTGKSLSVPHRILMKCPLKVWMASWKWSFCDCVGELVGKSCCFCEFSPWIYLNTWCPGCASLEWLLHREGNSQALDIFWSSLRLSNFL